MNDTDDQFVDELCLMLDIFNSCIMTKTMPEVNSPCHLKLLELMVDHDKEPTAK